MLLVQTCCRFLIKTCVMDWVGITWMNRDDGHIWKEKMTREYCWHHLLICVYATKQPRIIKDATLHTETMLDRKKKKMMRAGSCFFFVIGDISLLTIIQVPPRSWLFSFFFFLSCIDHRTTVFDHYIYFSFSITPLLPTPNTMHFCNGAKQTPSNRKNKKLYSNTVPEINTVKK